MFTQNNAYNQEDYPHLAQPEDPQQEMLRLLREMHAVICAPKSEPPSVEEKEIKHRRSRSDLRKFILEIMQSGEVFYPFEIYKILTNHPTHMLPGWSENDVSGVMAYMTNKGQLERVQLGRYRIVKKEETNA